MTLDRLPTEWRTWLLENAARGCDGTDLAQRLVGGEVLSYAAAVEAVREAFQTIEKPVVVLERPVPHFDGADRVIDGHRIRLVTEFATPRIVVMENLLSLAECEHFITGGRDKIAAIDVVNPDDGALVKHQDRRGEYTTFTRGQTPLIATIEDRISRLLHWPVDRGEGFQLIHYGPGDEYRPHFDWFDPKLGGSAAHLKNGGQRLATLIIYLNKPEQGGATSFPKIGGFTVYPVPGSAVYFDNLDEKFVIDPRMLHCGELVTAGEKWIATKWLRVSTN
jgi:prolyl 4-hydroxylase